MPVAPASLWDVPVLVVWDSRAGRGMLEAAGLFVKAGIAPRPGVPPGPRVGVPLMVPVEDAMVV